MSVVIDQNKYSQATADESARTMSFYQVCSVFNQYRKSFFLSFFILFLLLSLYYRFERPARLYVMQRRVMLPMTIDKSEEMHGLLTGDEAAYDLKSMLATLPRGLVWIDPFGSDKSLPNTLFILQVYGEKKKQVLANKFFEDLTSVLRVHSEQLANKYKEKLNVQKTLLTSRAALFEKQKKFIEKQIGKAPASLSGAISANNFNQMLTGVMQQSYLLSDELNAVSISQAGLSHFYMSKLKIYLKPNKRSSLLDYFLSFFVAMCGGLIVIFIRHFFAVFGDLSSKKAKLSET